ncbi:MAG: hypothetical protein Kow00114_00950 [Kiloniellaceae bacterium]
MSRPAGKVLATAFAGLLLAAGGGAAAQDDDLCRLLLSDLRPLDAAALDAESLHGLGLPADALLGQRIDFAVILWDESSPRRPAPPASPPSPTGQGSSTVTGSAR